MNLIVADGLSGISFDGMMPVERTYTYEGTGKYPSTMKSSASYEDGVDVEICRYTYLETDSQGNWTKRRVKRTWEVTTYYPEMVRIEFLPRRNQNL